MKRQAWQFISRLRIFLSSDGQDMVEYALIIGLLALGVLTAADSPGQKLNDAITSIANGLTANT